MCAMFRDQKPDEQNGPSAKSRARRIAVNAEFQRTQMWQLIGGLQGGRAWILR